MTNILILQEALKYICVEKGVCQNCTTNKCSIKHCVFMNRYYSMVKQPQSDTIAEILDLANKSNNNVELVRNKVNEECEKGAKGIYSIKIKGKIDI